MERGQRMAVRGVLGPSPGWKYVVTPAGREWRGIKLDEVRA
jgi:hypothetical protein